METSHILAQVDEWLVRSGKRSQRNDGGWFHPSSLSNQCDMAVALDFLGYAKPAKDIDPRVQRIFSIGHGVDKAWKERLKKSGLSVVGSKDFPTLKIEIPAWRIRGECDDIIRYPMDAIEPTGAAPDVFAVAEIKSINQRGFDGELPLPEHRIQCHCYMKGHGLRDAFVIYENKNDSQVKIVHVPFDDVLWNTILQRIVSILEMIEEKTLPHFRNCKYGCDFGDVCRNYDEYDGLNRLEIVRQ